MIALIENGEKNTSLVENPTQLALDRTLRLAREHVGANLPDDFLVSVLQATSVIVAADRANLRSPAGQEAVIAVANLVARSGAQVFVDVPNIELWSVCPPLLHRRIVDAVIDLCSDLIPGCVCHVGHPATRADIAVVIGDTRWRGNARRTIYLSADIWRGSISQFSGEGFGQLREPLGALAAAGIAAGEAYKSAMARLESFATRRDTFWDLFAPIMAGTVALAPAGTPSLMRDIGEIDVVSGGAIAQAFLYTLVRIPEVQGRVRVIEPEVSEITNLNRYMLLRHSRLNRSKAGDLASFNFGALDIQPMVQRLDEVTLPQIGPLARTVLVGVDHIPTRWLVQRVLMGTSAWLGVGATSHYAAMASYHDEFTPCAWCLHPRDEAVNGPIPTVSFVSFFSGLWLTTLLLRYLSGNHTAIGQSVFMTSLRVDMPGGIWYAPVAARPACPNGCIHA